MINSLHSARIVIAGGSGFLGVSLGHYLANLGAKIVILSRNPPPITGPWNHVPWDGRNLGPWQKELDGTNAIINIAGRSVDCVKTPAHQDEILRSRVEATRVLGQALRAIATTPPVWVQMSTAHIYGDPPEVVCTEDSPLGYGLAPHVGREWEAAFRESILPSQRGVVLRTSFVIGRDRGAGQGALARLLPLARWGLGGRVGSGQQGMSWIHENDMNRLFERALVDETMQGTYIASAPEPVSQVEYMRQLRRVVGMPIGLPAFSWMVYLGARWLLNTDPELALYGRYVVSQRLAAEGFVFEFPQVAKALEDLVGRSKQLNEI